MYFKSFIQYCSRVHPVCFRQNERLSSTYFHKYRNRIFLSREFSNIKHIVNLANQKNIPQQNINSYTNRTHTCGELRYKNIGEKVTLCGWLQFQRLKKFLVLRDGYGVTQLVITDDDLELQKLIHSLPYESILKVEGVVVSRPEGMTNPAQQTGEIEVQINRFDVLNKAAEDLPFHLRDYQKPKEPLRMQYRYLDLRFPEMQFNLRTRSWMLMKIREFLIYQANFVDVETPTLFKATPGGAQEYIVPTRFPGQFYSLVQSPQQFKQMLMAGAIDRYFQIARCYRDEGSRSDRQPEFTQLDIEMSFTSTEGIRKLVEDMLHYSWPKYLDPLPNVFNEMTYEDAMEKYGSDKPDTRFNFELRNITQILKPLNVLNQSNFYSTCIIIGSEMNYSSSIRKKLDIFSQESSDVKFLHSKIRSKADWMKNMGRILTDDVVLNLWNFCNLTEGCIVFLAFGPKPQTLSLMGKVRTEYANLLEEKGIKLRRNESQMLWVTNFPLFELDQATGKLQTVHHPFTAPHPEDLHLLDDLPLNVRSLAYDLVLNGNEIGGGSIRIHNPILQKNIFQMLSIDSAKLQHILHMLSSGCPPHGGIALGIDRLMATILKTPSIRDVIAFPKTFEGRDPISGAPSEISEKEKHMYHILTAS